MKLLLPLLVSAALAAGPGGMAPLPPEDGSKQGVGPDPSEIVGAPTGPALSGAALHEKTRAVASLLRCVVCQGLSVADSPSDTARAMRDEVQEMVAKGFDQEQILTYFEASYGEFVLLEPKLEGVNVLVWVMPIAFVLGGVGIVAWTIRSSRAAQAARQDAPSSSEGEDPYLARVRAELSKEEGK